MSPLDAAVAEAVKVLERRDRLRAEVTRHLTTKGFDEETVELAIAHLIRRKFLDDARVIEAFVAAQKGRRAHGPEWIRAKLLARGAEEAEIEAALAESVTEETVFDVLKVKFPHGGEPAKMARFLAGRGFTEDQIEAALASFGLSSD